MEEYNTTLRLLELRRISVQLIENLVALLKHKNQRSTRGKDPAHLLEIQHIIFSGFLTETEPLEISDTVHAKLLKGSALNLDEHLNTTDNIEKTTQLVVYSQDDDNKDTRNEQIDATDEKVDPTALLDSQKEASSASIEDNNSKVDPTALLNLPKEAVSVSVEDKIQKNHQKRRHMYL